jgi:hypothetical protein
VDCRLRSGDRRANSSAAIADALRGVQTHKKKEIETVTTVKRIMPALIVSGTTFRSQ